MISSVFVNNFCDKDPQNCDCLFVWSPDCFMINTVLSLSRSLISIRRWPRREDGFFSEEL